MRLICLKTKERENIKLTLMQKKASKKSNRRMRAIAILVVLVGLLVYFLLKPNGEQKSITQDEPLEIAFNKQGELAFIDHTNSDTIVKIDIEIADDNAKRARGLMYRKSIPENGGMLFIQGYEEIQSFWMKNTYITLDMVFVNSNKEIVTIHHNTAPLREWSYSSTEPALYVVEVNGGFCHNRNIKIGDRIDFVLLNN